MSQETNNVLKAIPHLVVLITLLVIEYWILMTHASTLISAGDYGPLVAAPLLVALLLDILIVLGLKSICDGTETYKKMVTISLIIFLIQAFLIFIEYVLVAVGIGE